MTEDLSINLNENIICYIHVFYIFYWFMCYVKHKLFPYYTEYVMESSPEIS